jgi:predicted transcriptional regulator YdeE
MIAQVLAKPLILAGRNRTYMMQGPGASDPAIKEQWASFMSDFGAVEGQVGFKAYGVCHSFDAKLGMMDYMCAVEVVDAGQVPNYFFALSIPARQEAVFLHDGDSATIAATWDRIFKEWLPAARLDVAQGPQFEVYGEDGAIEIHVPIKIDSKA